ncbi:MAG: OmpA family protein [Alphaproteobacteria bacterium]|nr:OmpA family protein [Alphaproteobacteria bacterium]
MSNRWKYAGVVALTASFAALAGCASKPDAALSRAAERLAAAQANPDMKAHAAGPLADASRSLSSAIEAENTATRHHFTYMADKNLDIAEALLERRKTERAITALRSAERRTEAAPPAAAEPGIGDAERNLVREMEQERLQSAVREAERRSQKLEESLAEMEARGSAQPVVVPDIRFAVGESALSPGNQRRLEPLVLHLRDDPSLGVVVEGYTDNTDRHEANLEMSLKRASAVKAFLVGKGIAEDRIQTLGLGAQYPIASNDTPDGRRLNRRVEIVLSPGVTEAAPQPQSGTRSQSP